MVPLTRTYQQVRFLRIKLLLVVEMRLFIDVLIVILKKSIKFEVLNKPQKHLSRQFIDPF
tara:strand:+ start:1616 stop:1795 length:180 start_codon:yes stop_codon:yes gene_type:complete